MYILSFLPNASPLLTFQANKREKMKKEKKAKTKNMTEDEMIAEQQRLINQARLKVWGESTENE